MASSSFKAIIEGFFQRHGGWPRLKGELAVYYWPKVAGPEITARVEAIRFHEGFLYLQTDNAALAHQLSLLNLDIVRKYRKILGSNIIKGVKIKIGTVQGNRTAGKRNEPEVNLTAAENELIEKCGRMIIQTDLADSFIKLMKKHYLVKRRVAEDGGQKCRACGIIIEKGFEYCPCCERQLKEENEAYLKYLKKARHIKP